MSLEEIYTGRSCNVVDVRNCDEYFNRHIKDSRHYSLAEIPSNLKVLERDEKYYVHCAGGYRSVIAISLLKKGGYTNLVNIEKGFKEIRNSALPME